DPCRHAGIPASGVDSDAPRQNVRPDARRDPADARPLSGDRPSDDRAARLPASPPGKAAASLAELRDTLVAETSGNWLANTAVSFAVPRLSFGSRPGLRAGPLGRFEHFE